MIPKKKNPLNRGANNDENVKMPTLGGLPSISELPKQEKPIEITETFIEDEDDIEEINLDNEEELEDAFKYTEKSIDEVTLVSDPMINDEAEDEDKYIDKKNKKIIPMRQGKKSKRKVKASDFDDRKNTFTTIKVMRTAVMLVVAFVFFFGLKSIFFPSHVYTKDDIQSIAQMSIGETGFPKEAGASFAEDFIAAYLTLDPTDKANRESLSYFYSGGNDTTTLSGINLTASGDTRQKVIGSPRVYESLMASEYSAAYKVSALVTDTTGEASTEAGSTSRWLAFSVNVYYDTETSQLSILPNNPTLIPKYEVNSSAKIPQGIPIGNGQINNDILPALTPTIDGFVKAYASSSVKSHNDILQYVTTNPTPDLYTGFGGSVEIEDTNSGIQKVVYNSDIENEYKVMVSVKWVDKAATQGQNKVTYDSDYVMTINKTNDEKYVVTAFRPYTYLSKPA